MGKRRVFIVVTLFTGVEIETKMTIIIFHKKEAPYFLLKLEEMGRFFKYRKWEIYSPVSSLKMASGMLRLNRGRLMTVGDKEF